MKITEFSSDQRIVRIDLGFDHDVEAAESVIQQLQHRLTSDGFAVTHCGRRDTLDGVSVVIEAVRYVGKTESGKDAADEQ
jgi:hypothetical protein